MKKWILLVIGAFIVFGLGYSVQHLVAKEKNQSINEEEVTGIVQSLYDANVTQLSQSGNHYDIQMENEFGTYAVQLDRNTGDIRSLTLLKKKEVKPNQENNTENQQTEKAKISEQKAAEIALSKVEGEVDDIDLEQVDGSYAYKIEIETDDDDAIVYVQAYTGEILSFTFED